MIIQIMITRASGEPGEEKGKGFRRWPIGGEREVRISRIRSDQIRLGELCQSNQGYLSNADDTID